MQTPRRGSPSADIVETASSQRRASVRRRSVRDDASPPPSTPRGLPAVPAAVGSAPSSSRAGGAMDSPVAEFRSPGSRNVVSAATAATTASSIWAAVLRSFGASHGKRRVVLVVTLLCVLVGVCIWFFSSVPTARANSKRLQSADELRKAYKLQGVLHIIAVTLFSAAWLAFFVLQLQHTGLGGLPEAETAYASASPVPLVDRSYAGSVHAMLGETFPFVFLFALILAAAAPVATSFAQSKAVPDMQTLETAYSAETVLSGASGGVAVIAVLMFLFVGVAPFSSTKANL